MGLLPDACQWRVTASKNGGKGVPRIVVCGQSAKYVCPDGEVRTILVFEEVTSLFIGPCCMRKDDPGTRKAYRRLVSDHPDWPKGYEPFVPPPAEVKAEAARQRWFRHALEDIGSARGNGLVRADNSDDNLRHMPGQPVFVRRVG